MVRRKGLIALAAAVAVCTACRRPAAPLRPAVPKIRATVVTIETKLQPSNKSFTHSIVIAGGRARSSDDVDSWRLFDLQRKQVTFVDDVARTYQDVALDALLTARRKELARPLSAPLPRAEVLVTGAKRFFLGVEASEHLIRLGGYQRHLWIARHRALPDDLFAMAEASVPRTSPLAAVGAAAGEALMTLQGFPLLDRAELPYGNRTMVVERAVVSIEQKDVPRSWLEIGRDYKDLNVPRPGLPPPAPSVTALAK